MEKKEKYIAPFTDYGFKRLCSKEEQTLMIYRDMKNCIDTAKEKGYKKGIIERKIEIANKCLKRGMTIDDIVELTGLPKQVIEKLQIQTKKKYSKYNI